MSRISISADENFPSSGVIALVALLGDRTDEERLQIISDSGAALKELAHWAMHQAIGEDQDA